MVTGLELFRDYFRGDEDKYVLIVEALTPEFGRKLWAFIDEGDYSHKAMTNGKPQFFRFTDPQNPGFPKMIELFARTDFEPPAGSVLTPIHVDDEIASLSAILLNEDYYRILLEGRQVVNELSVLRTEYLILFKAKAYLDLKAKRDSGEEIHSSEYKKHKKDVLRIIVELAVGSPSDIPTTVRQDIRAFIDSLISEPFDVNTLISYGVSTEEVIERLTDVFF